MQSATGCSTPLPGVPIESTPLDAPAPSGGSRGSRPSRGGSGRPAAVRGERMRALLYHDVAPRDEWDATGFEGGDAAVYKFERADFERHLDTLATIGRAPSLVRDATPHSWLLTFDDG